MRKLISVIIISLLMLLTVLPALAYDYDFYITVSHNISGYKTGDTFTVKASVVDINDEYGLAVFDYSVVFDPKVLECVNAKVTLPKEWEDVLDSESGGVENLSGLFDDDEDDGIGGGIYRWVICVISENMGLKDSGKLSLDITFKVVDGSAPAEIKFVPGHSANDLFADMDSNQVAINIEPNIGGEQAVSGDAEITVTGNHEIIDDANNEDNTSSDDGDAFPAWAIIVIVIAVIAVAGAIVYCVLITKRNKNETVH